MIIVVLLVLLFVFWAFATDGYHGYNAKRNLSQRNTTRRVVKKKKGRK